MQTNIGVLLGEAQQTIGVCHRLQTSFVDMATQEMYCSVDEGWIAFQAIAATV